MAQATDTIFKQIFYTSLTFSILHSNLLLIRQNLLLHPILKRLHHHLRNPRKRRLPNLRINRISKRTINLKSIFRSMLQSCFTKTGGILKSPVRAHLFKGRVANLIFTNFLLSEGFGGGGGNGGGSRRWRR